MPRKVLLVANPKRPETLQVGEVARLRLEELGITAVDEVTAQNKSEIEIALVLGGDGTMLHAANEVYGTEIPLLGVNLGRVGFLAELEKDDLELGLNFIAQRKYRIEKRGTLAVRVIAPDGKEHHGWALNEATVERADVRRMLEVAVAVDNHPLTSFGCDGLVIATPTGSTAHAFSGGGPVIWPDLAGMLLVPLAAHALFARPLVVGPESVFAIDILDQTEEPAQVALDGARTLPAVSGAKVEVSWGKNAVYVARLDDAPFTQRLVRKFSLPTVGWRSK